MSLHAYLSMLLREHTISFPAHAPTHAVIVHKTHTHAGQYAVKMSSVEFHKLRLVLEDFGRRSARAQVRRSKHMAPSDEACQQHLHAHGCDALVALLSQDMT